MLSEKHERWTVWDEGKFKEGETCREHFMGK